MSARTIVSIVSFIIAFILGKLAYGYFFGRSEIASFELSDWNRRNYICFQFEAPFELSAKEIEMPPSVKRYIKKMENYLYESDPIVLIVSRVEYTDGTSVDLDGAAQGAIQNMKASKGMSDFVSEVTPIEKFSLEGRLIKGTCKVNGKEAEFTAELYKSDLMLMQAHCVYAKHDENREIANRIMSSLNITL